MIKERYCSYEVAKLLKEKGFREWCQYCYGISVRYKGHEIDEDEEYELKAKGKESEIEYIDGGHLYQMTSNNNEDFLVYACPTHQMACDWLREKYDLHIEIKRDNQFYMGYPVTPMTKHDKERGHTPVYYALILDEISNTKTTEHFSTYAEAVESALKYLLEKLI